MDIFFSPLMDRLQDRPHSSPQTPSPIQGGERNVVDQKRGHGHDHHPSHFASAGLKITILDDYQDAARKLNCFSWLQGHDVKVFNNTVRGIGQLSSRLAETEILVLIGNRTHITAQLLDRLPQLLVISQMGKTGEHIDIPACTERGIIVFEGSDSPTATAELTWALIMAAQRRIPHYVASLKQGAWQQSGLKSTSMPANFGLGQVLQGQTLGILGYEDVGKLVASYGRVFGMKVMVYGSERDMQTAQAVGLDIAKNKAELFAESDILSVHLPLTAHTRGVITRNDLLLMKPTSLFVNTSHAELIRENALLSALGHGRPGMAAIDVYEHEPILQGYSLLRMENVICTPHIGYVERENYELYFSTAFRHILNYIKGEVDQALNTDALKIYRRRPHHHSAAPFYAPSLSAAASALSLHSNANGSSNTPPTRFEPYSEMAM